SVPLPDIVRSLAPVIWSAIVTVLLTANVELPVRLTVAGVANAVPSSVMLPLPGLGKAVVELGLENVTVPPPIETELASPVAKPLSCNVVPEPRVNVPVPKGPVAIAVVPPELVRTVPVEP